MASGTSGSIHTTLLVMHSLREAGAKDEEFRLLVNDPEVAAVVTHTLKRAYSAKQGLEALQAAEQVTIQQLDMPARARNILGRAGIVTARDLALTTDEELSYLRGMGGKLLEAVYQSLTSYGLEPLKVDECTLQQLTLMCGGSEFIPAHLMFVWQDGLDLDSRGFLWTVSVLGDLSSKTREAYLVWRRYRQATHSRGILNVKTNDQLEQQANRIASGLRQAGLAFLGEE